MTDAEKERAVVDVVTSLDRSKDGDCYVEALRHADGTWTVVRMVHSKPENTNG